ncbi:MAG: trimethylamine methyltransferase family protein, partial [Thermoleophilia bacterium]|nr:trimethylamine methyltransferase family protein [Thermoleophilia bacterium]
MKASTTWLSAGEISAIVDTALGVLAETGMRFAGSRVLPLLAERGAEVDHATGLARLPRELVEWAAAQCPRSILMAGLTEADDVLLDEGEPFHFVPSGCVAKTLDFRTGERRASTLQDLRECTALNDELPQLDIMWTQVSASDVPIERRELEEYFTLLTETRKHVTFVDCPNEADAVLRIGEVLSGDLERFRARPRISTVVTAASPLQVDGSVLDTHLTLASHGVPVEIYSMAIAGATAPVTLAGTVTQGVAEFLGIATAMQVAA